MRLVIFAALALAPFAARAQTFAADAYFDNSLLCKSLKSKAVCDLWLNPSGRYEVFYDSGKGAMARNAGGAFQFEGRQGTYTARNSAAGVEICLTPDADNPPLPRSPAPALFHDQDCVTVPFGVIGQQSDISYKGEDYEVELVSGR